MTEKIWTIEDIKKLPIGHDEIFLEGRFAVILDCDGRIKRLFVEREEGYKELPAKEMVKECAQYISSKIDLTKILEEKLRHLTAKYLIDLHERIEKEPEVKPVRRCYSVLVKGKRGPPLEIDLVD